MNNRVRYVENKRVDKMAANFLIQSGGDVIFEIWGKSN